jgi:two-component system, LytTR family, response regulator
VMLRIVIIDDEELARRGVLTRLEKLPDLQVVAECKNAREAIDAIRRLSPDLVFLDVQMPGKSGFDVIRAIGADSFPYVIFVTAHDRYAMQAFEVNALDYLLKPLDDERFQAALLRAREAVERDQSSDLGRRLSSLLGDSSNVRGSSPPADRIVVKSGGRVVFVKLTDIDWVEAAGDYVTLHAGKKSWLLRDTIISLEKRLGFTLFRRIHRSTIVNIDRIRELRSLDNGEYLVVLADGVELKLSRNYRANLQVT